jgi:probable O-glycosylation ligase (exosortase A-associated)
MGASSIQTTPIAFPSTEVRVRSGRVAFASLLLFVVLVYSVPGRLFFDNAGDVGIAKAAAGLALVALGCSWLLYQRRLRLGGALGLTLAIFFTWMVASSTWSLAPFLTRQSLGELAKFFAIFFLVSNVVDDIDRAQKFLAVFAAASIIPAVGALWSFAHGQHLVEGTRASWLGTFGDPNDLAYHLATGVAVALGARRLESRHGIRLLWAVGIGIMLVAILFTQSRGGLITTGVVLTLYVLHTVKRTREAVPIVAVVIFAALVAPSATWQRASTTLAYEDDASALGRIDAWNTGKGIFAERPFAGVGLGSFIVAWAEYAPGNAGPARAPHNTFVEVLAETGLVGFVLFLTALALGLVWAVMAMRAQQTAALGFAVAAGLCAFAVASTTLGELNSWPLYILLGLASSLRSIRHDEALANRRPAAERLTHGR